MNVAVAIADQFKNLLYGHNNTGPYMETVLRDITFEEATTQVSSLNTIALLIFHIDYYVQAVSGVLDGKPLTAKDALSFDMPPLSTQEDWERLKTQFWNNANTFASRIENLPFEALSNDFVLEKYGNYYRNLHGLIEHSYYHFGQIVFLKKLLRETTV